MPAAKGATAHSPADLSLWERVSFSTIRTAMAMLLACVGLSTVYRFGRWFGTLEWLINYRRRRRFAEVMSGVFEGGLSGGRLRRQCREFFMHSRCDKLFFLILDCLPRERAVSLFSIEPRELLDDALADGRGAYIALAHLGPHHVAGVLMCLLGYKVAGVRDRSESGLRRYVEQRYRQKYPEFRRMRMFYAGSYPRNIYRCLREGYVLGSAMDVARRRHPNQKTETVTIFGEDRGFISGPLRVAIRSKVTVLQGFVLPQGGFRYRFVLQGPLVLPDDQPNEERAVQHAMSAYAANVEKYIRRYPAHVTRI